MKVDALMQRRVATVPVDAQVDAAARLMHERDCGCVVVVDADAHAVGVMTDRDVSLAALRTQQPIGTIPITVAMSRTLHACAPDDAVEAAERTMAVHQVRRLPVVDAQRRLVGLIALDDIAREARRDADLFAPPVSCAAVGRTLGEIVRPRLIRDST